MTKKWRLEAVGQVPIIFIVVPPWRGRKMDILNCLRSQYHPLGSCPSSFGTDRRIR